jgi:bifunctional DNase/RNase
MVLAVQCKKPIMVAEKVLNEAEDMTEVLEGILKQQN